MIGAQVGGSTARAWSARPLPGGVGPVINVSESIKFEFFKQGKEPVTGIARREVGKEGSDSGGTTGNLRLT